MLNRLFREIVTAGCLCLISLTLAQAEETAGHATPVTVAMVETRPISVIEEAVGRIEARFAPVVSAEETGVIVEIHAGISQYVKAGDLLARIDNQAYCLAEDAKQADVRRLKSLIANQEKTVERYQHLLDEKSIPQDRMDAADVQLSSLKSQLAAATAALADSTRRKGKTQCLAPVSGWIEQRFVTTGDFVNTGKPLFKITGGEKLRIVLPFPESTASDFRKGQAVSLTTPTSPDAVIESVITKIRPSVNVGSRAVEVLVDLDNPGGWRPGASVNGTVIVDTRPDAVMVPDKSIVRRPAGEVVYIVDQDMARERVVCTGVRYGTMVEIVQGLAGGETIAVLGAGYLTDQVRVRVRVQEKTP